MEGGSSQGRDPLLNKVISQIEFHERNICYSPLEQRRHSSVPRSCTFARPCRTSLRLYSSALSEAIPSPELASSSPSATPGHLRVAGNSQIKLSRVEKSENIRRKKPPASDAIDSCLAGLERTLETGFPTASTNLQLGVPSRLDNLK